MRDNGFGGGKDRPDAHCVVLRAGDDAPAIRADRDAKDGFLVSREDPQLIAVRSVPYAYSLVPRAGDDAFIVGANHYTGDLALMSLENEQLFAASGVPHAHRIVIRADQNGPGSGDDTLAIRADRGH